MTSYSPYPWTPTFVGEGGEGVQYSNSIATLLTTTQIYSQPTCFYTPGGCISQTLQQSIWYSGRHRIDIPVCDQAELTRKNEDEEGADVVVWIEIGLFFLGTISRFMCVISARGPC